MDFEKFCENNNKKNIEKGKVVVENNNINYTELLSKYSNKSKAELFTELVNVAKKQKENGTLNQQQLISIYNTLSAFMSPEEQEQLKSLIKTINEV